MKVAILSESPADDAAIRILVDAVLGVKTEAVSHTGLRARGWPSVRSVFPAVLKQLHYHTDADGLVLVVDSNGSSIPQASHEQPGGENRACRLCQLRGVREEVLSRITPRATVPALKTAIGIAVPTIEAWLLCDVDPHVSEASQRVELESGHYPQMKSQLKARLYGTARPSLSDETTKMTAAALRLTPNLSSLHAAFPSGFGALASDLCKWL
ncbi:MAG: hypothetical protein ABSA69_04310 [Verrucomicrobiota bacterium]|jgi:hypothetical protein